MTVNAIERMTINAVFAEDLESIAYETSRSTAKFFGQGRTLKSC